MNMTVSKSDANILDFSQSGTSQEGQNRDLVHINDKAGQVPDVMV